MYFSFAGSADLSKKGVCFGLCTVTRSVDQDLSEETPLLGIQEPERRP